MNGIKNRKCAFKECLAYYDGKEIKYFDGNHDGELSEEILGVDKSEKWSDLWYIFKPKGFEKTLAEIIKLLEDIYLGDENPNSGIKGIEQFVSLLLQLNLLFTLSLGIGRGLPKICLVINVIINIVIT